MPDTIRRVYKVTKANSGEERLEGYSYKNVVASYVHLHFASNMEWAENLTKKVVTAL